MKVQSSTLIKATHCMNLAMEMESSLVKGVVVGGGAEGFDKVENLPGS